MSGRVRGAEWVGWTQALLLLATIALTTRWYVAQERWIPYWDQALYQDIAWRTTTAFQQSLGTGLRYVQTSLHEDYNVLFALPLVPLLRVLGESRASFETALAVATLLPLPLAVGSLASRIIRGPRRRVYWSAAWVTLFTPMIWVPTLRGFPDALPAACVVWALCSHIDARDGRWLRRSCLAGVLIGLAVLLRRHFGYAAVAFFAAVLVTPLLARALRIDKSRLDTRAAGRLMARLAVSAVAAAAVVGTLGSGFILRVWSHDFGTLYSSYAEPVSTVLRWYAVPYGVLGWLLAVTGAALAIALRTVEPLPGLFGVVFGTISAAQWCLGVRQLGEQYTLHFTPGLILGVTLLGWTVWLRARGLVRSVLAELLTVYLAVNVFCGLSPLAPEKGPLRPFMAAKWAPLVRDDYGELKFLMFLLHHKTTPPGRVFVAASSHVINPDIVRQAEWMFFGHRASGLDVLAVPEVDSRDYLPLGRLLDAQAVLVTVPAQYHLRPEEQAVLGVVHDLFWKNQGLARDFERLTPVATLIQHVYVYSFCRVHDTSLATALDTLELIRRAMPKAPGMQPDWVGVDRTAPSWLTRNADGSARWIVQPGRHDDPHSMAVLYLGDPGRVRAVGGRLHFTDARCRGVTLALSTLDATGAVADQRAVQRRQGDAPSFTLDWPSASTRPLLLRLQEAAPGESIDFCLVVLDELRAETQPPAAARSKP
jgi:hypothetical protein